MVPPKYLKKPSATFHSLLEASGIVTSKAARTTAVLTTSAVTSILGASQVSAQSNGYIGNAWPIFHKGNERVVNTEDLSTSRMQDVAFDGDGDFVVAYEGDDGDDKGVFIRRFDDTGAPLGAPVQVNTYTTGTQGSPAIAVHDDGSFVVAWHSNDEREYGIGYGYSYAVNARFFNADGTPRAGEFRVNDWTTNQQLSPNVAVDNNGDFTVIWYGQDADYYFGIQGKTFNNTGTLIQGETQLSQDLGSSPISKSPGIAMDDDGDFVIAYRNESEDVYVKGLNANFTQRFAPIDLSNGDNGYSPAVGMDNNGNFTVAWSSSGIDSSGYGIEAQHFNANGNAQGAPFQVNTYENGNQYMPDVAMDGNGNTIITWHSDHDGGGLGPIGYSYGVFGQRFDSNSDPIGEEFRANVSYDSGQMYARVAMDSDSNFAVVFTSYNLEGYYYATASRLFQWTNGSPGTASNTETAFYNTEAPSLAFDADGNRGVVTGESYDKYGPYGYDVYIHAQRIDSTGSDIGGQIVVTDELGGFDHYNPRIAINSSGDFIVVWETQSLDGDGRGIFARQYNADGSPQDNYFQVNTATVGSQRYPNVGIDAEGNFVIAWIDDNTDQYKYRRFNSAGSAISTEQVLGSSQYSTFSPVALAVRPSGDFLIAWPEGTASDTDIMAERFDASGTSQGGVFSPHTATPGDDEDHPSVAFDYDGNFVITWEAYVDGTVYDEIQARLYHADGSANGNVIDVNSLTTWNQQNPSVAFDSNGNFTIAWETKYAYNYDDDIHARTFDKDGNALTPDFAFDFNSYYTQREPQVAHVGNGKFMFAWETDEYTKYAADGIIYLRTYEAPIATNTGPTWLNLTPGTTSTISPSEIFPADPNGDSRYTITSLPGSNASLLINGTAASIGSTFGEGDSLTLSPTGSNGSVDSFGVAVEDLFTGQTDNALITLYIGSPQTPIQSGSDPNDYGLYSIPSNTETTWDVLASNFGAYNTFIWRAYGYNNGYVEGQSIPNIDSTAYLGRGVWLISAFSQDIQMGDNPPPTEDVTVSLNAGWNLIGNPFLIQVSTEQIQVDVGNGFVALNAQSTVDASLFIWDRNAAGYVEGTSLNTFQGAWIYANSAATLKFVAPANQN